MGCLSGEGAVMVLSHHHHRHHHGSPVRRRQRRCHRGRGDSNNNYSHGLVVFVLLLCLVQTTFPCPRDCFCEPHSKNVHCTNKGLTSIPAGIPYDTVELILNQNTFLNPDLTRRNFTNLVKLQKLYMSRCGIETIAVDTFKDLTDLVWLDISNNKITFIADHTFRGLHLKHLFINDNHGVQLANGAFEDMSTQGLYMHNTGMSSLSVRVMSPLNGTLRTLWLYQNQFESFSEEWLYLFNNLGHLRLGGNPFHCNCEIGWLHKFFNKHSSVFSGGDLPSCASPAMVRFKRFSNLTADDFRCDLPTFRNVDAVFEREMGRLTCQARGDPTPTLYWVRPDGTTEIYSPAREDAEQNEGVLYMTNVKLTDSARYKCVASNPAGNVTFSLNVVWPEPPPVPTTTTTTTTTTTPTTAPASLPPTDREDPRRHHHHHNHEQHPNVIVADATPRSTSGGRQQDAAVPEGKAPYPWGGVRGKPEMKLGDREEGEGEGEEGVEGEEAKVKADKDAGEVRFTLLDLVGAVVGTFSLTVLLCVAVLQLYWWRKRERLRREDHYSVPDSKPPLAPARLYIMGEEGENRVRMLHNHGHPDCPT